MLGFVILIAVLARVTERDWAALPGTPVETAPATEASPLIAPPTSVLLPPLADGWLQAGRVSVPPAAPEASLLVQATQIEVYAVEDGDSLVGIAARQGISTQTLFWANQLDDPDLLRIGQEVIVPPVDGVVHTVEPGETLNTIAERYSVTAAEIVRSPANDIENADVLIPGSRLMVPGGVMPRPVAPAEPAVVEAAPAAPPAADRYVATGRLQWPTTGPITTYFMEGGHRGLDIAPRFGTPIYAADAGRVVTLLAWDRSFGWHIVLDHGNGMTTLYAHLSKFAVAHGQRVEKGEVLGYVGSTGYSTGPHLHFEIAVNGQLRDPMPYLR